MTTTDDDPTREILLQIVPNPSATSDDDVVQMEPRYGYFTLNTRKYLEDRLTYDPAHDAAFRAWAESRAEADDSRWGVYLNLHDAEEWADWLGVPYSEVLTVNTYNGESNLDDTLQYVEFEHPGTGERIVMLQVHQGGDVRGNYSEPRVFVVDGGEGFGYDVDSAEAYCDWTPPQEETLPDMPDVATGHYFSINGPDIWGSMGETYTNIEIREDLEGEEVYACPNCLEGGVVRALTFSLPYPSY